MSPSSRVLLISNSTLHGRGYLDHVEQAISDFLGPGQNVLFFPFALHDRDGYAAKAQERFAAMVTRLSPLIQPTRRTNKI